MSSIQKDGIGEDILGVGLVAALPVDGATAVIYVLVAVALFVIWYGDRQTRKAGKEDSSSPMTQASNPADEVSSDSEPQ